MIVASPKFTSLIIDPPMKIRLGFLPATLALCVFIVEAISCPQSDEDNDNCRPILTEPKQSKERPHNDVKTGPFSIFSNRTIVHLQQDHLFPIGHCLFLSRSCAESPYSSAWHWIEMTIASLPENESGAYPAIWQATRSSPVSTLRRARGNTHIVVPGLNRGRSRPDHDVWILTCENAIYRVSRYPDRAANIERLR